MLYPLCGALSGLSQPTVCTQANTNENNIVITQKICIYLSVLYPSVMFLQTNPINEMENHKGQALIILCL